MVQDKTEPTLVVLAAGLGSRFGGMKQLKPMGPGGHALLEYTAFDAIKAGFRDIVFIIQAPVAEEFSSLVSFLPAEVSVRFAFQDQIWPGNDAQYQRAKPWGTGHALLAAKNLVDGPFVICNADDYYGSSAFVRAAGFFDKLETESTHYAMLGYSLGKTLPDQGDVSRALCMTAETNRVSAVTEHPKIRRKDGVIVSELRAGKELELNEADRVSMNFWLLTQSIFGFLDSETKTFIEQSQGDPDAECRLPDVIDRLIRHGDVTVECVPHDDKWFGLTHAADYEDVAACIQSLHDDGSYPTPLWQNDA